MLYIKGERPGSALLPWYSGKNSVKYPGFQDTGELMFQTSPPS